MRAVGLLMDHCPSARPRIDRATGELIELACRRLTCPYCGPRLAFGSAEALVVSRPERFLLFTLAGEDFPDVSGRMKAITKALRSNGRTWEQAAVIHENPRRTGHHVHAVQHGSFVPLGELIEVASALGMGRVTIRRIRMLRKVCFYMLRPPIEAAALQPEEATSVLRHHLFANGGRLLRSTRSFYRDELGNTLGGEAIARRRIFEERRRAHRGA